MKSTILLLAIVLFSCQKNGNQFTTADLNKTNVPSQHQTSAALTHVNSNNNVLLQAHAISLRQAKRIAFQYLLT